METLSGRTAVVTGAASGIGRALVERFAAEGMSVVAADVDEGGLAESVRLAGDGGGRTDTVGDVVAVRCDVTDRASVDALAVAARERFGPVAVLCNNAGVFTGGVVWEVPPADLDWVLGVNVAGILNGLAAFVPAMLRDERDGVLPGHIVNTCSVAGLFATPYTSTYTISKFAAFAATECLAHDLALSGSAIGVSALCPGAVDTGIARSGRNRPDDLAATPTEGAEMIERVLAETIAGSLEPAVVAGHVVDAVRADRFLVLTSDTYAGALVERAEALRMGVVPPLAHFD